MSAQELDSYRFTSYNDPTDEMLETIMHEAGEEVRSSNAVMQEGFERQLIEIIKSAFAVR